MNPDDILNLSNEELIDEFNKIKPSPYFDAFFIGFLIGIVIFGIVVNTWGFATLLPLYLAYIFLKKGKRHEALKKEMHQRGISHQN